MSVLEIVKHLVHLVHVIAHEVAQERSRICERRGSSQGSTHGSSTLGTNIPTLAVKTIEELEDLELYCTLFLVVNSIPPYL